MSGRGGPTVSLIVPVHSGGENFRRCLASLADCSPQPMEIIVVADGDTDDSWRVAGECGAQVLRIPEAGGPARARNLGAKAAKGDVLLFVDADVAVTKNAVALVVDAFQKNSEISAFFGSYDDEPAEVNFLSQYKNLFHHYVHQTSGDEASTFWAGCGAIRRDVFTSIGCFDERFRRPAIEDIELGYRLRKAGHRIRLLKTLKVKHLKHWGIMSLLKADFFNRALPWTNLILNEGRFINDLNLRMSSRISVVLTYTLLLTLLGAFYSPWILVASIFIAGALLGLNRDLYRFFTHKRGPAFALGTIPWHWFYFFYSGLAFGIGFILHKSRALLS